MIREILGQENPTTGKVLGQENPTIGNVLGYF